MNLRHTLAALTLSAVTALCGWLVGHATTAPTAPDTGRVAAFNDGWQDAMRDACDQGSAYACDWLSR
ncbi:hypothetical protein [Kitasatospora sp. NPDC058478]|uniref:hypothetical protein n=1 Tax=unclassified Kitasatospora TaxID=2633591 RepID=UPI003647F2C8